MASTGRTIAVRGFDKRIKARANIPIATAGTLWVDPSNGTPYILVFHETLFFGDEQAKSLLNPNQLHLRGLVVDECPRQFSNKSTHKLRIPLSIHGVASGFISSKPTQEELETLTHIEMTSEVPWEPYSPELHHRELAVCEVATPPVTLPPASSAEINADRLVNAIQVLDGATKIAFGDQYDDLYSRLVAQVRVASDDMVGDGLEGRKCSIVYPNSERRIYSLETGTEGSDPEEPYDTLRRQGAGIEVMALETHDTRSVLTPAILSRRWGIGLSAAQKTLKVTTQKGVRNELAQGERKVRQWLNHCLYPEFRGKYYSDTMFAKIKSKRAHTSAQVFTIVVG
jgi:hypothetical protein